MKASARIPSHRTGVIRVSGDDAAVLILNDRGMIRDCNRAGETLFKCRRSGLVWRHVSMLVPHLLELDLLKDGRPNPYLRFLSRIGSHFEVVARDGERFASELFLNLLGSTGQSHLSLIVRPVAAKSGNCRGGMPADAWQRPPPQRIAG